MATGRATRDISADIKGALTPHHGKHFAAITDPVKLGELIRIIRGYQGGPIVRAALQLAPMLFQRPGELRAAAWAEFDLDAALWTIPAARMKRRVEGKKNGDPHLVPLPTQAVEILRKLHTLTGHGTLLFPGERSHDRPISDNTLWAALLTLGYGPDKQSVHGFRATARTMLAEIHDVDPLVIEAQLFPADRPDKATDFNDLHQLSGLDAVKGCIEAAPMCATGDANLHVLTDWPELQPLIAQIDAQEYPIDALPAAVRCAVQEVAGFVKAPIYADV